MSVVHDLNGLGQDWDEGFHMTAWDEDWLSDGTPFFRAYVWKGEMLPPPNQGVKAEVIVHQIELERFPDLASLVGTKVKIAIMACQALAQKYKDENLPTCAAAPSGAVKESEAAPS